MNQKAQTIDQKLKKLMQQAITLHRDGKLDEAEPLYRNHLAIRPPLRIALLWRLLLAPSETSSR